MQGSGQLVCNNLYMIRISVQPVHKSVCNLYTVTQLLPDAARALAYSTKVIPLPTPTNVAHVIIGLLPDKSTLQ